MDPQGLFLLLQPFSISALVGVLVLAILLLSSALVSGAEVAYFSLSKTDQNDMTTSESRRSLMAVKLLANPRKLLATILITNNFVNVGIVILSSYLTKLIFDFSAYDAWVELTFQIVVVTSAILLMGEVIPKVYASKNPRGLAQFMSYPLLALSSFFKFPSMLLLSSTAVIDRKFKKKSENISIEEFSKAMELTNKDEVTDEQQKMLQGIVKFGSTDVKQIMKPRVDVKTIARDTDFLKVIEMCSEWGYSRIPVHKETFDHVEGILYLKDLLPHINETAAFEWQKLVRTPMFVPENKMIDDLLKEFQTDKTHLAIVVDEYGGTSGIVTLEDIIEEIVGEINDVFDDDDLNYSKLDETTFVFEGKTPLNDFYRILNIGGENFEIAKGESDSLAGFIIEQCGKIPIKGDEITFESFTFVIESADSRRVKRIKTTFEKENK